MAGKRAISTYSRHHSPIGPAPPIESEENATRVHAASRPSTKVVVLPRETRPSTITRNAATRPIGPTAVADKLRRANPVGIAPFRSTTTSTPVKNVKGAKQRSISRLRSHLDRRKLSVLMTRALSKQL